MSIIERFDEFVDRTNGCWIWTGKLDSNGYGMCGRERAHRVSWRLANGPIPDGGNVLHHCDNPRCVRPEHLFLGSIGDNNRDRHAKGRSRGLFTSGASHPATQRRGAQHWHAKLSDDDVAVIRSRRRDGATCAVLAAAFGVHTATISRIARGIWRQEVPQ